MESGGERYEYIEALNSDLAHIDALTAIVKRELAGWMAKPEADVTLRQQLADKIS